MLRHLVVALGACLIMSATGCATKSESSSQPLVAKRAPLPVALAGGVLLALPDGTLLHAGGTGWADGQKFWTDQSFVYDPKQDTWTPGPRLPRPVSNAVAAHTGDRWLVIGGEDGKSVSDDVLTLEQRGGAWAWRSLGAAPFKRSYAAGAGGGGAVYVVGGADTIAGYGGGDRATWVGSFDTAGVLSWRRGPDFTGNADSLSSAAWLQGRLYVFGGIQKTAGGFASTTDAFALDPHSGWQPLSPLPRPLRAAVAVATGGGVLLISGWGDDASFELLHFDPAGNGYRALGQLPNGMVASAGVAAADGIYVAGNEDRPRHRSPDVLRIQLPRQDR